MELLSVENPPTTAAACLSTASRAHCAAVFGSLLVLQTSTLSLCAVPVASFRPPALLIAFARASTAPDTSGLCEPATATSNSPIVMIVTGSPFLAAWAAPAGRAATDTSETRSVAVSNRAGRRSVSITRYPLYRVWRCHRHSTDSVHIVNPVTNVRSGRHRGTAGAAPASRPGHT